MDLVYDGRILKVIQKRTPNNKTYQQNRQPKKTPSYAADHVSILARKDKKRSFFK
jgi:hypothetical protein